MIPSIQLVQTYIDPADTFRAETIDQMYSMVIGHHETEMNFTYDIGIAPAQIYNLVIRNNTTNIQLHVNVQLPLFAQSNTPTQFIVNVDETSTFQIALYEYNIKARAAISAGNLVETTLVNVTPMNVNGPVYIKTTLPPL